MGMAYPIARVTLPRALASQVNGHLPASMLQRVGVSDFVLVEPAARAFKALVAAAAKAGIVLSATGTYRSYADQESLFLKRYTTQRLKGRPTKRWQGRKYWQVPNTAMAAVPGTSNHGWGLAVDFALDADGDPEFEWPPKSLDRRALDWLLANAVRFGWSWEAQSEPWHLRYVAGDAIPPAVLAYEKNGATAPRVPAAPSGPTLTLGSTGDAVVVLQTMLNAAGAAPRLVVDGQFGPRTGAAVRAYQHFAGLKVDGIVGPTTWARLTR